MSISNKSQGKEISIAVISIICAIILFSHNFLSVSDPIPVESPSPRSNGKGDPSGSHFIPAHQIDTQKNISGGNLDNDPVSFNEREGRKNKSPYSRSGGNKSIGAWTIFWDPESHKNITANGDTFTHVYPYWYTINHVGSVSATSDPDNDYLIKTSTYHELGLTVMPILYSGDYETYTYIMETPDLRISHILEIRNLVNKMGFDGIEINYEALPYADRFIFVSFIEDLAEDGIMKMNQGPPRWRSDNLQSKIENSSGGSVWEGNTSTDKISMATPLEYDIPYSAKLYADDLQGGKSRETVLDFTLRNYPPLGISNFSFRLPQPLMPEFSFTAPQDPDSDPIAFYFDLMEEVEGNYSTIISRQYFNQSKYRMRANLSDHSFYTLLLWAEDSHGAASPVYNYSFYLNRAPFPVKNLTVEDLKGYENGLNISWTATDEDDIAKYEIYRFENSTIELEKYGPIAILENDNHYNDLELIDDVTYYYCVVGVDEDGAADHHNFTLVSGIPLDDVPPAPIDDLKVQDRVNSSGSLEISWNASNDGRFQGYRIYRNLFPFNSTVGMYPVHTTVSKMATDTFWIDVNVSDNVSYYYAVVAFDRSGNELQTNLHWVMGISINDTELAQENDEETGDKEKDEESEIRSYFLPIAIVSGVICILSAIILLMILKKSSKKREHKEIVESKTVSSIKADEVENKIEYEKLYGKIGKSQHKQSDKSSKRLKEFAQQRQKRRFREGKYRKKSKEGDGSEEFWIEYEEDNSTEKIEGTDDSWDWLDEPD